MSEAWVSPTELLLDGTTAYAESKVRLVWGGELTAVGLIPLYLGEVDPNILVSTYVDEDGADPGRGEGIFDNKPITHTRIGMRDDDTGPRTLRVYAETKSENGRYHGTAVDFGTLTVVVKD